MSPPDLATCAERVRALPASVTPRSGTWTAAQVLAHCAASIEGSLQGYPQLKPALVRATVGPAVLRYFLWKGALSHDRNAPIPGVADAPGDLPLEQARARLLAAIDAFTAHAGALAPHFIYGPVRRDDYARVHAMHLADHLADLESRPG